MRAAVQERYGGPDVVAVREVDQPVPGAGELLVRVEATTVNRTDCAYRAASPPIMRLFSGLTRPRAPVLGNEFAGEVTETGPGASQFAVGDRIFGYIEGSWGGHAEYLTVDEDASIARIPDGVDAKHAAAATEGAHYALAYTNHARVGPGMEVMVYGATGGIGSAAVQLCSHLGATVTAVGATPHLELVEELGADRVVDYTAGDFPADLVEEGVRFDTILDAVGKRTFGELRVLLAPDGLYLSTELGPKGQNPLLAVATRFRKGQKVAFPVPSHDKAMIEYLANLLGTGAFTPVIDRTYPLDQIVEAYEYVESGQKIGNVVIVPGG